VGFENGGFWVSEGKGGQKKESTAKQEKTPGKEKKWDVRGRTKDKWMGGYCREKRRRQGWM
jgi:hypothetical protein